MDEVVLAAMAKWPRVPAVFGWLRLDGRGQWWLREERLDHPSIVAFFNRNYTRDGVGRYYVQNGPQKVYVELECAPFVARLDGDALFTVPYTEEDHAREAFMTPEGQVFLEVAGELAVLDDRDLLAASSALRRADGTEPDADVITSWQGGGEMLFLQLGGHRLHLEPATHAALLTRYGVQRQPRAG